MSTPYRRDLERLRYWQGQTLRSRDYRDQSRFDARRRQWHNRALHWMDGVAFGLEVTQRSGNPQLHDVACGLAYDCRGRELLLQRPRAIARPAEASWLILRLAPTTGEPSSCCAPSDPGCLPDETRLLDHDFELVLIPTASLEAIDGVALAKFTAAGIDAGFRRREARPLARPRLARGQTVRGNTSWEPWAIDEPDGRGGIRKKVVGVQTRIDTSAAGFTRTPCYFAAVDSPTWDISKAEFAPAFFPHVAEPTVDGFTFRLLMVETARRRYTPSFGTARVSATARAAGERLQIDVDSAAPFQKGDPIALLRPRARELVRVKDASSGNTVTLTAALEGAAAGSTSLAIGNLPRSARVIAVSTDPTMVATFAAKPAVKAHDVLSRTADGVLAVIDSVDKTQLTVAHPFPAWSLQDDVSVARLSKAVTVTKATRSTDGSTMSLELTPATHAIDAGLTLVLLDKQKVHLAKAAHVTGRNAAVVVVQPALDPVEIAGLKFVAPFTADISIKSVQPKSVGIIATMDSVVPFVVGDFVAVANDTSAIATVDAITAAKNEAVLSAGFVVSVGADLVAANWRCATTVSVISPQATNVVFVGRPDAVLPGSFVVRREADGFSKPVTVMQVNGLAVTLAAAIPALKRLDTLAVGVFPRFATVSAQQAEGTQIGIVEAGALAPGDNVVLVGSPEPAPVAQVVSAIGNAVVLNESLGQLSAGQRLAVVHFRDSVALTDVDVADPTRIEIDRDTGLREHDVVGVLTHYADNSNTGFIESIQANRLTLTLPGIESGDGIVDDGWIDGGIVGAAAVVFRATPPQFQPFLRLTGVDGLEQPRASVAYGLDLIGGRYVSRLVMPFVADGAAARVFVWPLEPNGFYRFRPETLSLITTFNADFPRAFATFAQKQKLSVRWFGCLREFPPPSGCPGEGPYDVCDSANSPED